MTERQAEREEKEKNDKTVHRETVMGAETEKRDREREFNHVEAFICIKLSGKMAFHYHIYFFIHQSIVPMCVCMHACVHACVCVCVCMCVCAYPICQVPETAQFSPFTPSQPPAPLLDNKL